ncbi:MAG: prepilin peptidase [Lachnospiraceae bacterium]|nr:prepilin peptidase [Lachnospiraceae bacterium]
MPTYSELAAPAALITFILGLVSGSFVCEVADRLPRHENFIYGRSHCESCGAVLSWYELIPLLSFLFQHGRCRRCGAVLSPRYPLIETVNGVLYLWVLFRYGLTFETLIGCLLASALLGLSLIDLKTMEIPYGFNIFILILGIAFTIYDRTDLPGHLIGLFAISVPLLLIQLISRGRAIGGGDIKLMAAAGLLLGWKGIILAFVLACIIGSVIHLIRMKFFGQGRQFAFGPYLSAGIFISWLYSDALISAYLSLVL